MDPCVSAYAVSTIAATPTVVRKSVAICGKSESVTRTCAWLAKPAAASRMMERVGVLREGDDKLVADTSGLLGRKTETIADVDTTRGAGFLRHDPAGGNPFS